MIEMTDFQKDPLWKKLEGFTFDQSENVQLSFQKRLARENGWSAERSKVATQEYLRFLYLAAKADHPVTPSDEVDQVWHLHLQYSQNYWSTLCQDTLEFDLHHGPTKGGAKEGAKYQDWYAKTKESYEQLFGMRPPEEFWPENAVRFGLAPFFKRVNTKTHFVIDKKDPALWLATASILSLILGLILLAAG